MGKPNKASNGHLRVGQPMPEDKEPRERTRGRRSGRVTCPPKNDQWRKRQDQPGSNTWTRPRYTRWAPVNKTILAFNHNCKDILSLAVANMTVWPSGQGAGFRRQSVRAWVRTPQLSLRHVETTGNVTCLLYTSPSPRDKRQSRMPSSA